MSKSLNKKSVINTYTKNALILIILSAFAIGSFISLLSLYEFIQDSRNLEEKNISLHKEILKREVSRAEKLIKHERSKLDSIIRNNIKDRVYEAHKIATDLYNKYKNIKSKNEIETLIIEALRPHLFFEGRGYFYALSLDGIGKLSANTPQLEGKNLIPLKTKTGDYFIKELIKITKENKEGFYDYIWSKPNKKGDFNKIAFVKHFEPFDWLIGTGDYIIDVEQKIKQNILKQIGKIQFGKEGYIFVVNYDGTVMMNSSSPSIIGKNIIHTTDANGIRVAHEVIKRTQDPSWDGFFNYSWKKRTTSKIAPKISYNQTVPEWRWYYGSGVYTDDINTGIEQQRDTLEDRLILQLFFIITTILIAVSILFILSKKRAYELNNDLGRLLSFFEALSLKSSPLNANEFTYSEFNQLALSSNLMLEKQQELEKQRLKYEKQILQNQKMSAINQLVGGISHDFNNLLGVILGYGEMLEDKLTDNKQLMKYAHQINAAGKRGSNLTKKLLSLTEQKNVETENTDINSLLLDEEELLKKSLTAKIQLKLQLKDKLWPTLINQSDFEDVILNLCVNAMHAMHEGQQDSKIRISTEHTQIKSNEGEKYNLKPGDYVKISVTDNGCGMDAETKERIFEPFYTTREAGHGLGLSQVYSFAKQCNGIVLVQSTVGKGSTFEILIPRNLELDKSDNNNYQPITTNKEMNSHKTILIVDDEISLRELSADYLRQKGYQTFQAENGIEALKILEKENIDLVLSDIIMPIMDGHVLAEKVKRLYPDIKIQLISGYMNPEEVPESNKELYETLLKKPVSASDLLQRVNQLLNQENIS